MSSMISCHKVKHKTTRTHSNKKKREKDNQDFLVQSGLDGLSCLDVFFLPFKSSHSCRSSQNQEETEITEFMFLHLMDL